MTKVMELDDLVGSLVETERLLAEVIEALEVTVRDLETILERMDDDGR